MSVEALSFESMLSSYHPSDLARLRYEPLDVTIRSRFTRRLPWCPRVRERTVEVTQVHFLNFSLFLALDGRVGHFLPNEGWKFIDFVTLSKDDQVNFWQLLAAHLGK